MNYLKAMEVLISLYFMPREHDVKSLNEIDAQKNYRVLKWMMVLYTIIVIVINKSVIFFSK